MIIFYQNVANTKIIALGNYYYSTMSDNEASSSYESGSYESESDSSTEQVMLKPVYLKKSQRSKVETTKEPTAKTFATVELVEEPTDEFGVDDTDDVDPEAEFGAWKQRELERYTRDRERMKQAEEELVGKSEGGSTNSGATTSSVFYNEFSHLKRDFSQVQKPDHSRPLKRSEYMKNGMK